MSAIPQHVPPLGSVTLRVERQDGEETVTVVDAPEWAALSLYVLTQENRCAVDDDKVLIPSTDGTYVYKVVGWSRIDRALICRLIDRP